MIFLILAENKMKLTMIIFWKLRWGSWMLWRYWKRKRTWKNLKCSKQFQQTNKTVDGKILTWFGFIPWEGRKSEFQPTKSKSEWESLWENCYSLDSQRYKLNWIRFVPYSWRKQHLASRSRHLWSSFLNWRASFVLSLSIQQWNCNILSYFCHHQCIFRRHSTRLLAIIQTWLVVITIIQLECFSLSKEYNYQRRPTTTCQSRQIKKLLLFRGWTESVRQRSSSSSLRK